MTQAEVIDVTTTARGFPEPAQNYVPRDNLLETIDQILASHTDVLILEGDEGIGKTLLLAELARRQPRDTLALFLRTASKVGYSQGYVRLMLAEQLTQMLDISPAPAAADIDDRFLHTSYFALQKRARPSRSYTLIVLDGVLEIAKDERRDVLQTIWNMLPVGLKGFKIVLSGDEDLLGAAIRKGIRLKPYTIAPFSLEETKLYCKDLGLVDREPTELHKVCRGVPGRLAIVRRLLKGGHSLTEILQADPKNLPSFIATEWGECPNSENHRRLLAYVCFGLQEFTVTSLATILDLPDDVVRELVEETPFLRLTGVANIVEFVSDAHRRYSATELSTLRSGVLDRLILYTQEHADGVQQMHALPTYLFTAGRNQELLALLSASHLADVFCGEWSLGSVAKQADLGVRIAEVESSVPDATRLTIIRSFVNAFSQIEILKAELEALLSLGEIGDALVLANTCVLKEDRLELLALVAKARERLKMTRDEELSQNVRSLCDQLDLSTLGSRAIDIASELVHTEPDLALSLIERFAGTSGDPQGIDAALVKISLRALVDSGDNASYREAATRAKQRIRDPDVKLFSDAVAVLLSETTAVTAIQKAEKLEHKSRLFLLRQWAMVNRERTDAAEVVTYSLDLVLRQTGQSISARDLREIATPLPYLANGFECRDIVRRLDALKESLGGLGTNEDFIRLELLLARTEARYDLARSATRAMELFYRISALEDLGTRTTCLAWLLSSLPDIDLDNALDQREKLSHVIHEELTQAISTLLASSADHFEVAKGAIAAFCRRNPMKAVETCAMLNTELRRNEAREFLIGEVLDIKVAIAPNIELLLSVASDVVDSALREKLIVRICKAISELDAQALAEASKSGYRIISAAKALTRSRNRCLACAHALVFSIRTHDAIGKLVDASLPETITNAWDSLDGGWRKAESALLVCKILGKLDESLARRFLQYGRSHRKDIIFDTEAVTTEFAYALELASRCIDVILRHKLNSEIFLRRYGVLVSKLPSSADQANAWCTLALRCFAGGHGEFGKRITNTYLRPCLSVLANADRGAYEDALESVAPALYKNHVYSAMDQLRTLSRWERDSALCRIARYIFTRLPLHEPRSHHRGDRFPAMASDDITDLVKIIGELSTDNAIYSVISDLEDVFCHKSSKTKFTKAQKAVFKSEIEEAISKKLPDKNNIQHKGYLIAAQIHLARIVDAAASTWDTLLSEARGIPNIADKVYVLGVYAASRSWKRSQDLTALVEEIFLEIEKIPSDFDRLDRYQGIAEYIAIDSPGKARIALERAMKLASTMPYKEDIKESQSRILDLAHRLDPKFAVGLANEMDDDPARIEFKKGARNRLRVIELRDGMVDENEPLNVGPEKIQEYAEAAWLNLSQLNANRLSLRKDIEFLPYMRLATGRSIAESFPIYAWEITNWSRRQCASSIVDKSANRLPIALLDAADFIARVASASHEREMAIVPTGGINGIERPGRLFGDSQRSEALQFIGDWITGSAPQRLVICDPYFSLEDLSLLQLIKDASRSTSVIIFAHREFLSGDGQAIDDSVFLTHWRLQVSEEAPPDTELVLIATGSKGGFPVHDRWLLGPRSGMRLGTSFHSLGVGKISEISEMDADATENAMATLRPYLYREVKEHLGVRLKYFVYSL